MPARLTYGSVTALFLGLAALSLFVADLHIVALHPWAEMARLAAGALQPDFAAVEIKAVVLTVAFAVVGVGLGAVSGLALSLVFARWRAVRLLAAGLRSIHELFWALILIQITGLSPVTGILAVAIPYAGIFAKVFAEMIEEADLGPERALPVGATTLARFVFVRVPLLAEAFRSYTLYRLECGLRSTLVLGFVGLPTLGFDLESYFAQGHYPQAAALILVFYALIATRGLWARTLTLPILVPGSLFAIYALTDRFGGDSLGANLARFGAAIVPAPLRRGIFTQGDWSAFSTWLWGLFRDQIAPGVVTTLVLSQLAVIVAGAVALVFSPAISQRFSGPIGRGLGRGCLVALRGTPEYVLAYILLQLFGPSMLPAILALGLHNGGIIGFLLGRRADDLAYRRDAPRGLDL
jgi:phosphonate transport system permease protein